MYIGLFCIVALVISIITYQIFGYSWAEKVYNFFEEHIVILTFSGYVGQSYTITQFEFWASMIIIPIVMALYDRRIYKSAVADIERNSKENKKE